MTSAQIDFATYCIGNLSERLGLPQKYVYNCLKSSGILSDYIIKGYDVLHTFGKGFYVTTLREQAVKYAQRFILRGQKAYLNIFDFNEKCQGYIFQVI